MPDLGVASIEAWPGTACLGGAWYGKARQGMGGHRGNSVAALESIELGTLECGAPGRGMSRHGWARLGKAWALTGIEASEL